MNYHALGVLPPGVEVLDGGGLTSARDSGKLRSALKIHRKGPNMTDTLRFTPIQESQGAGGSLNVLALRCFSLALALRAPEDPDRPVIAAGYIKDLIKSLEPIDPVSALQCAHMYDRKGDNWQRDLSSELLLIASVLNPSGIALGAQALDDESNDAE